MYLGAYHFDGAVDELLPAYHRLLDGMPPGAVELQLCAVTESGVTVLDACPSRAVFESFSTSEELRTAVVAAGLPQPRVEQIGELRHTVWTQAVSR